MKDGGKGGRGRKRPIGAAVALPADDVPMDSFPLSIRRHAFEREVRRAFGNVRARVPMGKVQCLPGLLMAKCTDNGCKAVMEARKDDSAGVDTTGRPVWVLTHGAHACADGLRLNGTVG